MATYSSEVIALADNIEKTYGVPASVTLAQYKLESGAGTSNIAKSANNYFNISGYYNGHTYRSNGRNWRKYDNMYESFEDYGKLLGTSELYTSKTKGQTTIEGYINAIAETYAPSFDGNSGYADKLIQIIKDDNLMQYDHSGLTFSGTKLNISGSTFGNITTPSEYVTEKITETGEKILSNVIKFVVIAGLCILAFIFMMQSFDWQIPSVKTVTKKAATKYIGGGDDGNGK